MKQKLRVLLDEGTPVLVGAPFHSRGHEVIYHSDVLASGASDKQVCLAAILNNAALIAVDRDMKQLAKRFGAPADKDRFPNLDLIFVGCNEVLAAKRVEHAMSFIENEWTVAKAKSARRLWLDIEPHFLRTHR